MKPLSFAGRATAGFIVSASLVGALSAPALARHRSTSTAAPTATAAPATSANATGPSAADMIPALEAQLKATPHDQSVSLRLAEAYLQVGRPDRTLTLCQALINSGVKKSAQVYFFQGAALRAQGRFGDAIKSFEIASNLDPTSPIILVELSNAYLQSHRVDDAYRVAKRASTFNNHDARVLVNYGVVLAVQKHFNEARTQFRVAEALAPTETMASVLEARTYLDQNQPDAASRIYDTILAKDPNNVSALEGKVQTSAAAHRIDDAVGFEERLFALATDDSDKVGILNDEARLYLGNKQHDKAEAVVRREVSTFPNLALAHISLGDLYISEGKAKDAVAEWNAALGPKQDNQVALMRLGMYALHQNDAKHAQIMFSRITSMNANDDAAWFHLGQSYQLLGQFDHARDAFRHAFSLRQTVQAFADIASCDYELHNYKEAAMIFDQLSAQASKFVNDNPNLLFIVAKTYDNANEKSKARSAYYRVLGFVKSGSNDEKTVRSLIANLNKVKYAPKPTAAHTSTHPSAHK